MSTIQTMMGKPCTPLRPDLSPTPLSPPASMFPYRLTYYEVPSLSMRRFDEWKLYLFLSRATLSGSENQLYDYLAHASPPVSLNMK
jgi:hypothetical protein